MTTLEKKLQQAFIDSLGIHPDTNFRDLAYREHELWDSVAHMQLISKIESDFDIMLDTDEMIAMSSFTVAQEILTKHGVSFDA